MAVASAQATPPTALPTDPRDRTTATHTTIPARTEAVGTEATMITIPVITEDTNLATGIDRAYVQQLKTRNQSTTQSGLIFFIKI